MLLSSGDEMHAAELPVDRVIERRHVYLGNCAFGKPNSLAFPSYLASVTIQAG